MVGAVLFAETTSLRVGSTPLFAEAAASVRLPRERIECPEVRDIRPFGCVAFRRFVRCRPATGATGVSARGCRTPASDVSEGFDVVRRRRQPAQKVSAGLCKRRHRAETTRSGANRQRRASRRAWAKADESHTFVGVARCVSCNSQCGPRRLGESRASRR